MKFFREKGSVLIGSVMISLLLIGWAPKPKQSPELGLAPLKESQAYRQFSKRPVNEYSKVIYLIERFKSLPYGVIYDGQHYRIKDVAGIVGAFLRFHYKKDRAARQWILEYANRTFGRNELILLRLSDGNVYPTGEILLQELESLEKVLSEPALSQVQLATEIPVQVRIEGNAFSSEALPLAVAK